MPLFKECSCTIFHILVHTMECGHILAIFTAWGPRLPKNRQSCGIITKQPTPTHLQRLGNHGSTPQQEDDTEQMNFTETSMLSEHQDRSSRQITLPPNRSPINSTQTMRRDTLGTLHSRRHPPLRTREFPKLDARSHERRQSKT